MKKNDLLNKMKEYGYSIFIPIDREEKIELLNNIADSFDIRLYEGFAVVFFNMIKNDEIDCDIINMMHKQTFELVKLSFAVFDLCNYSYIFNRFKNNRECNLNENNIKELVKKVKSTRTININKMRINIERVINTFKLYSSEIEEKNIISTLNERNEMSVNIALNRLFSKRQKEIILKRFNGEVLSKTEKEYFSRIIRKKLEAILNDELRNIAKTII